ncbi:MAG TPA: tripartite tricarboxylate transporter substrate-binding protein [Burkholderiaceae bacterium]|nr:tripartite tricarboxylate transporter substrate-binding protein [Burkholderiaceae bacterium]
MFRTPFRRALLRVAAPAAIALVAALTAANTSTAHAQTRPTLRILVGFPPGAGTDLAARIYGEYLAQLLNATVVVENKPGAGGLLAAQAMKLAPAESNTLMMTIDHQVVMLPLIMRNAGFDVRRDLLPVGRVLTFNTCLAVPGSAAASSLAAYVQAAKARPDQGAYGIPAAGSQAQFVGYVVGRHYDAPLRPVAYRGAAPAIADLVGGQVPSVVVPCDALNEHRKAGRLRVLAVAAHSRQPQMPDVPTFAELGVKLPTDNFVAVYAASSMPPELLRQVVDATQKMFQTPSMVERFNGTGMQAAYGSPEELVKVWERSQAFWAEQVRASKFQVE